MAGFSADLKLEGFKELERGLNPHKLMAKLRPLFRKQNKKMGLILKRKLVQEIKNAKGFAANAYATAQFKGSSNPLVAHGTLRMNCGNRLEGSFGFIVGTTRRNRKGVDIAAVLHEGAKIKVTPKMRNVWLALCTKTEMRVKPLRASTTHIIIPARPYLKKALIDDESVGRMVVLGWKEAMREAHRQFGARLF